MEDKFEKVMSLRTDEELIKIVTLEKDDYNPIAIETAEREILKRKIDTSNFNEIRKKAQAKKENKKSFELNIVDSGTRLLNSIIDTIVWIIFWVIISLIVFTFFEFTDKELDRYSYVSGFGVFFTYYIFMEFTFQKTVGKFITKTKVIKSNGEKPEIILIIARTFFRFIPFDGISFLFQKKGLHDILSGTRVIKDKHKTEKEKVIPKNISNDKDELERQISELNKKKKNLEIQELEQKIKNLKENLD